MLQADEALEAEECAIGSSMHWRSMEEDGADGADGARGEYRMSEAVKVVRTCQNLLGQDGTGLGLLLLHVGPNGDRFGGQACMEHYIGVTREVNKVLELIDVCLYIPFALEVVIEFKLHECCGGLILWTEC
jgi:hypothetical protein